MPVNPAIVSVVTSFSVQIDCSKSASCIVIDVLERNNARLIVKVIPERIYPRFILIGRVRLF
jgi:hypothetical protein